MKNTAVEEATEQLANINIDDGQPESEVQDKTKN